MLIKDLFIKRSETVKNALKKLDKTAKKVLLVVDNTDKLLGTITDGDMRCYILSGCSLNNSVETIYNKNPLFIKKTDFSLENARKIIVDKKIELLPVVDENKQIVDFITWDQVFLDDKTVSRVISKIKIPVVIMAGGKGTRLDPFTRVLPKPLIPVGNSTIIEVIIEEFTGQGATEFYLTLNHKSAMVEAYFSGIKKDYKINFVKEKDFLGTGGSLRLLRSKLPETFILSNCDVIVKANFEEALNFHYRMRSFLTVFSSVQHHKIPYGVMKFKKGGNVQDIIEKPEYTFTINTGVYILNKKCLRFIPKKARFDMTDLIKNLIKNKKNVFMYPFNESAYMDIGQWEEYRNTTKKLQSLL